METLESTPGGKKTDTGTNIQFKITETKKVKTVAAKANGVVPAKTKIKWFSADSPENMTVTEAVIRGGLVVIMPILSAIDWSYGTHILFYIAPVIFYLEVTTFTMFCPVKALFSNYNHPSHYE